MKKTHYLLMILFGGLMLGIYPLIQLAQAGGTSTTTKTSGTTTTTQTTLTLTVDPCLSLIANAPEVLGGPPNVVNNCASIRNYGLISFSTYCQDLEKANCLPPGEDLRVVFLRGDVNADGLVNGTDASLIYNYLYYGTVPKGALINCFDAFDSNDDGRNDLSDGVYINSFVSRGGPQPPLPYPTVGPDPTEDVLTCGIAK